MGQKRHSAKRLALCDLQNCPIEALKRGTETVVLERKVFEKPYKTQFRQNLGASEYEDSQAKKKVKDVLSKNVFCKIMDVDCRIGVKKQA